MNPLKAVKKGLKENLSLTQDLANQAYDYLELRLFVQLSSVASSLVKILLFGVLAILALIFASIALSIFIGEQLENFTLGFLLVAAGHLLLALGIILLRKQIERQLICLLGAKSNFSRKFSSINQLENELKKRDLERQTTREQLKLNYNRFEESIASPSLSTIALSLLGKIGIDYLKKRLTK